jgi:hypothetical protein
MFGSLERELRSRGENLTADKIASVLRERGSDIPFPAKEVRKNHLFSESQSNALEKKGYRIYWLTGQSVSHMRNLGFPFFSDWHKGEPFEDQLSMCTDVAFDPKHFYLPDSNRKPLEIQIEMVKEFGNTIEDEIPGVTAMVGNVADYAELAFAYQKQKRQRLFGPYNYACTTSLLPESYAAVIGNVLDYVYNDVVILRVLQGDMGKYLWAAPLVVPSSAAGKTS